MPNHVKNILIVSGKKDDLIELSDLVFDKKDRLIFSLNRIIPMPEEYLDNNEGGVPMWHSWRIKNWGSKWDVYDVLVSKPSPNEIRYSFLTANSTPIHAYMELSKRFVNLSFNLYYADEDMGYNLGFLKFENGVIISSDHPTGEAGVEFAEMVWDSNF